MADGDFGRCAADVTNGDAFRQGNARGEDRATVGERALLLLREHARLDAGRPRERSDEHGGVGRLAPGSGEEDVERGDALVPGHARHAADRLCRGRHMNGRDGAVPLDLLAQREPHLLGVEGDEVVGRRVRNEQPRRVRAYVDDPDPHLHAS